MWVKGNVKDEKRGIKNSVIELRLRRPFDYAVGKMRRISLTVAHVQSRTERIVLIKILRKIEVQIWFQKLLLFDFSLEATNRSGRCSNEHFN